MTITRELLRYWSACYTDERIAELVPAEGVTRRAVLTSEIPPADRVWVATRPGVLPPDVLRRWLGRIVRRALARVATPDPRSLAVLPYLDQGEAVPEDVRADATDAADAAAGAATWAAARAAWAADATDAAAGAAWAAAWASRAAEDAWAVVAWAARAAARAAAGAAARDADAVGAAGDAERSQQVADLLEVLP